MNIKVKNGRVKQTGRDDRQGRKKAPDFLTGGRSGERENMEREIDGRVRGLKGKRGER